VDDGSTDGTSEAVQRAAAAFAGRMRLLRHATNRGKTEAILTGLRATRATYAIVLDADLQYSPEEIPRFLAKLDEGWDIVTGRKVGVYEKQAVSTIYNRLSAALFDVPVHDLNSVKAFRRRVLDAVPLRHDWHRFLVVLAHSRGCSVTEIDVALHPRRAGASKYHARRRIASSVGDLLVVWLGIRASAKPLHFFGAPGLWFVGIGAAIGIVTVLLRTLAVPPPPFGYRPLLALIALLLVVGMSLLGFGFVGELIAALRGDVELLRSRLERGAYDLGPGASELPTGDLRRNRERPDSSFDESP
jgi:glycosyltransferase involved in cell wall biosynthesis